MKAIWKGSYRLINNDYKFISNGPEVIMTSNFTLSHSLSNSLLQCNSTKRQPLLSVRNKAENCRKQRFLISARIVNKLGFLEKTNPWPFLTATSQRESKQVCFDSKHPFWPSLENFATSLSPQNLNHQNLTRLCKRYVK